MTGPSVQACYALNGQVIGISAERPDLWLDFDRMLGSLRMAACAEPGFHVRIVETALLQETPGGSFVFDGEVPEDGPCRMFQDGEIIHLVFPSQTLSIHGSEGWAEIRVRPDTRITWTAWMLLLDAALDAGGQHMLHTAGLTMPDRDAIVLIHAPSGTGKTTTSLALASQGFGICSDDAMIVTGASAKAGAWGLPRHVKIHQKTAEMLPFVSPCLGTLWDSNGEQAVSLEHLREIVRVEDSSIRPVIAVLHLARSPDSQSRLVAMARTDAMVALAADNVRTGMTGLLPLQKRRLSTIAKLVTAVPTYTLEVGASPADAAALISAALAGQG
ncbi:serine kinase [Mesorhizobium shangrilense]|uniref:Serine kinase n=1 Tax=Mesorhizobium shangrilense TaxID=460060 RepID=A0ABV2DG98_9HYPH